MLIIFITWVFIICIYRKHGMPHYSIIKTSAQSSDVRLNIIYSYRS